MNEDEIIKLRREIEMLKQQIKLLQNHTSHSPLINKILDYIREVKIISVRDLRQKFPTLYGTNLAKLYMAVRSHPDFRIIEGGTRWYPAIICYIPNDKPTTKEAIAFDYFQRIPTAKWEIAENEHGKKVKKAIGKEGTIKEIMEKYGISEQEATEVMEEIFRVFENRIIINKKDKAFKRIV